LSLLILMSKLNGLLDILSDDDTTLTAVINKEIADVSKQPLITARKIEFLPGSNNGTIEMLNKFHDLSVQFYEIAQIITEIETISPFIPSGDEIRSRQKIFIQSVDNDLQEVQLDLANRAAIFIDEQKNSQSDLIGSDTEYVECVEHT
jgi:hypothetical protein